MYNKLTQKKTPRKNTFRDNKKVDNRNSSAKPFAKKAPLKQEQKVATPEARRHTIYVGNLNYKMNEHDVKYMFFSFGRVLSATLIKNKNNFSTGIAFVEISGAEEAKKAIKELNGKIVLGRVLKVSIAKPNEYHMFSEEKRPRKKDRSDDTETKSPILGKKEKMANSGLALLKKFKSKSSAK
jgi:RNA recognition motif-containing protein